ncbi:helix-turn-helix domain-containing protein [Mesonia aestuariivivens]|uniref:Helix-turn-helix domain-containing protein n=1 Tax=Mesonia aestuariivivens TaxID=2796128 RepID=A0ABS6W2B7_9FLAO|nr:helix-turn-helix domain-containing protein [Mesonia aestuariivivens]MBW2961959.1 helix-turn-helix domain-containing protein [Mesonia aestuariivivens]
MSNVLFYSHTKEDLQRVVKMVLDEVIKTESILSSSSITPDDRLSQKQAAKFLGVSVTTIITWKKQNKIPYYSVGRSIFYSKKELLEVAKQNRKAK